MRVVAAAGLLALAGCPGDDSSSDDMGMTTLPGDGTGMDMTDASDGPPAGTPTHEADIQPIWNEHCVDGCHEPGGTGIVWLDMSPGVAYGALVNVDAFSFDGMDFVEPGDTNNSFLWHKINGTQAMAGGGGVNMPMAREGMDATVLTDEQFDLIEAWINGGAPE